MFSDVGRLSEMQVSGALSRQLNTCQMQVPVQYIVLRGVIHVVANDWPKTDLKHYSVRVGITRVDIDPLQCHSAICAHYSTHYSRCAFGCLVVAANYCVCFVIKHVLMAPSHP